MSGKWITAANRSQAYPRRTRGERGNGVVSDMLTGSVLRELARIAHDAGIVQVGVPRLADSLNVSPRAILHALKRLQTDRWIDLALRGTGNRWNSAPRESVYVLRRLPDADGVLRPDADWLAQQWLTYTSTRRFRGYDKRSRQAIRAVWSGDSEPVDNGPTRGTPESYYVKVNGLLSERPFTTPHKEETQEEARVHPREAERRRGRMRVVQDAAPEPEEPNAHPDPDPEPSDAHADPDPEPSDGPTYPDGRPIPPSLIPPDGWEPPSRPRDHASARRFATLRSWKPRPKEDG